MSPQEQLKQMVNNNQVDYLAVSGSKLYGTNRPISDDDLRGFILPGLEYLIGVYQFNDMEVPGADHKVYSLKRYIDLILNGSPQETELLFAPKDKVIKCTEVGQLILDNRKLFISKRIYRRVTGYGYSEFRKSMGVKLEFEDKTDSEEQLFLEVRNFCRDRGFVKDEIDEVLEMLQSHHERKLVSSLNNLGAKRKAEFEKYGFGTSSAAHSIRLANELIELMLTGELVFPRPEAATLKAIRFGEVPKEDVVKMYEEAQDRATKALEKCVLPDKPDYDKVYKLYTQIVKNFLKQ